MTMDQIISILVTITLIEMMAAIGLGVTLADLAAVLKNGRLLARAVLANYVCVPALTVGLLYLLDPHPMVKAGFLILAVCPGAPYGPPFTAIARGNVVVAVGLMVLLAGSSAIFAPLLLYFLLPLVSGDAAGKVDATAIVGMLLLTQLLPLCIGVAVRHWRPALAESLQKPANLISKILNLAAVGLILVVQSHLLTEIRPRGIVGMVALLIASMATGWLLGGTATDTRRAMAVTTSLRNVGVGLVIAAGAFEGTPAITAVVAFGLVSLVGALALATFSGTARSDREDRMERPTAPASGVMD
jgi:BASS family bile acid:Na+ symporter